jgi:DNA-binding NarL/FixJ family response regulator
MGEKVKMVILDDHPLIIDGLKQLISANTKFEVVAACNTFQELEQVLQHPVDILILDLNIKGKNSLDKIEEIRLCQSQLKILIFSSYNTLSMVRKALDKNVAGYLLKDTSQEELLLALETILQGQQYLGKEVAVKIKTYPKKIAEEFEDDFMKHAQLTDREKEIMWAIVDGADSQSIAQRLFISLHTVQSHRKNLFKKLSVHSAAELIKKVLEG